MRGSWIGAALGLIALFVALGGTGGAHGTAANAVHACLEPGTSKPNLIVVGPFDECAEGQQQAHLGRPVSLVREERQTPMDAKRRKKLQVLCPEGTFAVGGGYSLRTASGQLSFKELDVIENKPIDIDATAANPQVSVWLVEVVATPRSGKNWRLHAHARCLRI